MNIDDLIMNGTVDVSIKSVKLEHPKDACARRFKDITLFIIAMVLILIAFIFCGYAFLSERFSSDFEKWAMTIDGSIIVGFLSFLTGKNIKY
jgi:hypothetical protein